MLLRRAVHLARRRLAAAGSRHSDRTRSTYAGDAPDGSLEIICEAIPCELLQPHQSWITSIATRHLDHRFDLLGSGWVRVAHGSPCPGFDGVRFSPSATVAADSEGRWLAGRINAANLPESRRIWRLVDPDYTPIDWQLDFRSGYRWREDCWSGDISFGRLDGVDIKLPWEIARMQHLVLLAWAHRLSAASDANFIREYRNQILDFVATNPPRFGVNWRCTMDVAIRAANWIVAWGLFRTHGAHFDMAFEERLKRSLVDHGRHIVNHLEIHPTGRANHYLANVCGLLFIAACLPRSAETDGWLAFAAQELAGEIDYQFNPDGTNFEGSTFYHRLSAEMASYATAVLVGLPAVRRSVLDGDYRPAAKTRPHRRLAARATAPEPAHVARLERAGEFISDLTKPDGCVPQIGDNDGGRFLKPHPVYPVQPGMPDENQLDQRGTLAAIAALTGRADLARAAGDDRLDTVLVTAIARGHTASGRIAPFAAARMRIGEGALPRTADDKAAHVVTLAVPGGGLRLGLRLCGYPDFGLWLFRSDRLFLAIRCGPTSAERAGGSHAHNDQLAIELAVDGDDWIADPGSYRYCPPETHRNAWRSVRAHAAPQWPGREPASLADGLFCLADKTHARCLHFGAAGFVGEHYGFPRPIRRIVELFDDRIVVRDIGLPTPPTTVCCTGREAVRRHFTPAVPFAAGYGRLARGR